MSHTMNARLGDVVNGDFGRESSALAEKIIDRIYDMPVAGLIAMLSLFPASFPTTEMGALREALRARETDLAEADRENAAFDRGWGRAGDALAAEGSAA